ncbi:uroporphyrinogen-III synthase [Bradyrhizobium sp.]|uniref:uroporphyrinogen-III synthase n=1 Tax=Bradyrhizobium sp. TaxID=376 RepID=UPI0025C16909|nr:uroporphyrinogen-III synthase [Bradyrhizobium sp.]MBV8916806.1 uroporphyrinogen-III synthase [Bradyrhizobium sp.]
MAVLVTRPYPDSESTAAVLRARGLEPLLAPVLRFEAVPLPAGFDADAAAVLVTSANALRAVEPQLKGHALSKLPLFAVGEHSATAARRAGFEKVFSADGDGAALRDLVLGHIRAKRVKAGPLLHLSGETIAHDLAAELGAHGIEVTSRIVYRMVAMDRLPEAVRTAFAAGQIEAVLHYSARSAAAFLQAARADGIEISALAVAQCCISAAVARVLREAGAARVMVAGAPNETALLSALERSA